MAEGSRRLGDIDSGLATAECVTLADALAYESVEAKEAKVGRPVALLSCLIGASSTLTGRTRTAPFDIGGIHKRKQNSNKQETPD